MIRIDTLRKEYGDIIAVNDLSLSIEAGRFFGLLGPNGAGKTTLIRLMVGLIGPDSGQVHIDDHLIHRDANAIKKRIGIVSQHINLDKELSVAENMEFSGRMYGLTGKEARKKADEMIAFFSLEKHRDKICKKLSGGMKRKLMIAKALMHDPIVLFLDEPTVGVDAVARRDIWRLLKEINERGTTILLTTHYMDEAHNLCDEIGLMNSGKILRKDTPEGLIDRLGRTAVETDTETRYFKSMDEAKTYAGSLSEMYTMRKTSLEDVFISVSEGASL